MLGTMNLEKKKKHIPRHVDNRRRVDCSDRSIRVRASDRTRSATFLSEEQKAAKTLTRTQQRIQVTLSPSDTKLHSLVWMKSAQKTTLGDVDE
jgi:hypothetical protein